MKSTIKNKGYKMIKDLWEETRFKNKIVMNANQDSLMMEILDEVEMSGDTEKMIKLLKTATETLEKYKEQIYENNQQVPIEELDIEEFEDTFMLKKGEYKEIKGIFSFDFGVLYYYQMLDGQYYTLFGDEDILGTEEEVLKFLKGF